IQPDCPGGIFSMSAANDPSIPVIAGNDSLLAGVSVLDLTDGLANLCTRYLADLGADVLLVEPPQGSSLRHAPPMWDGQSLQFGVHNANKRGVMIELSSPDGRQSLRYLVSSADIIVDSGRPGRLAQAGVTTEELRSTRPD